MLKAHIIIKKNMINLNFFPRILSLILVYSFEYLSFNDQLITFINVKIKNAHPVMNIVSWNGLNIFQSSIWDIKCKEK